ncbi:DUF2285 domain-containing protein [Mesorhizobium sp. M5C.F.Ca.IN.020.29.1.1]|uniref:DNA -binding domain-containing protein n=1 Tax=Mesorhizobium sp. M5C.F.Ca.IN.020.29.1.1 TaxID=2496770 RepID=UPI000FCBF79F|nr:DUF2285 domain-containing protein [Mesorhizobium sp. M5C.F.Ca.IN.020.29.1.1]RUV54150.1 DUF2285 domain-containing protein [Mesorhizobium sp. M5C.F.Ca.IN.020.29.1.1]
MPAPDPNVADEVPWSDNITPYDDRHKVTYMRLLDAEADGADWQEVARIVLHRDPVAEPQRTRRCWEEHLRRAKWMTITGYRKLLAGDRDTLQ